MAIRFITGAAGSGKSRYCIEAVKNALLEDNSGGRLVFLVPEQATYQIERQILADERIGGYSNAYIVSFNRLGFWLVDRDTALEPLTKTARYLIISRILRENKGRLKVFGSMVNEPGMINKISAMITELYKYGKCGFDLMDVVSRGQGESITAGGRITLDKFYDISLIYDEYIEFITGRFENPDAQLGRVKSRIADGEVFKGCRLWVDGFSGFTPVEYEVLTELLKVCADAEIALCLPDDADDRPEVFLPVLETRQKLEEIISKNNLQMREDVALKDTRRFAADDLKCLERNIFRDTYSGMKPENIKIVSPANCAAEVEYIATRINSLVFEQGYRYRDIAVILSDMEAYQVYVRQMFDDFGIPYFIDKRRNCLQHPLIHLLLSAMRVVSRGFERVDVFSCLKTAMLAVEGVDIQLLENYCIARGIEKADWLSPAPWQAAKAGFGVDTAHLEQVRKKAVSQLIWLDGQLKNDKMAAKEFAAVISDFLKRLKAADTLKQWQKDCQCCSDEAAEHTQVYRQVIEILNEIAGIFADETVDVRILINCLCDSLGAITAGVIPPGQDQVMISEIERSRHPELKAVFVAGAVAKKFPIAISDVSLLSDYDRGFAGDHGCELDQGRIAKLNNRYYLAYIALTRASHKLWLSFPRVDGGGKKQQPSDIVSNVISLFDGLEIELPKSCDSLSDIRRQWQLKDYLCINGGRNNYARFSGINIEPLASRIKNDELLAACAQPLERANAYANAARINSPLQCLETSVSKLQCYAACPYNYFAKYVLRLKPRELFVYDPLTKGVIYHDVLDLVSKQLLAEGMDFASVDERRLVETTAEKIDRAVEADERIAAIIRSSRHNGYIFDVMKRQMFELVRSLRLTAQAGGFRLAASEADFGLGGVGKGLSIKTPAGSDVLVRGKIDRIDVAPGSVAVVYDYKSRSNPDIDWQKLYYGLDIQLPVYVLSVNSADSGWMKGIRAVAAFYIPIVSGGDNRRLSDTLGEVPVRKARGFYDGDYAANLDNTIDAGMNSSFYAIGLKKDGGFNKNSSGDMLTSQEMERMSDFVRGKIGDICDRIIAGDISISPYNLKGNAACEYCDYKPLCRFDRQINDSNILADMGRDKKKRFFEMTANGGEQ